MGGSTTTYPTTQEGSGAATLATWPATGNWASINVTGLIQHLVDTYGGLASGAHILFHIQSDDAIADNTENGFQPYEGTTNLEKLTITYTVPASAALSGTITSATESDIVSGGKTIILTLTGDTYVVEYGTPAYVAANTKGTTAADSAGGGGGRTSNGDLTCSWPSSYTPTAGHFALMLLYSDQGTGSTPSGWSQVSGSPFGGGTEKLQLFYKVLTGGESAPVTTISGSTTNMSHVAQMVIYSGVRGIGAIGTASNGTGTPMTAAAITTTEANSIVCGCCGRGDNENASSQTFGGSSTGVNERLDGGTAQGNDSQVSMADKSIASSGTNTGSFSATTQTTDPWVAVQVELLRSTPFDSARQAIINGLDSAQSEATGWDAVVKAGQGVSGVVRTSDTVCTITLSAFASYNISANETITATVPASALSGGSAIVASPTFTITVAAGNAQTLTASSTGTATYARSIGLIRLTSSTATAGFVRLTSMSRTANSTGTPAISRSASLIRSVASTATAALSASLSFARILTAASTATASFIRYIERVSTVSTTGAASAVRVMSMIQSAAATISAAFVRLVSLSRDATSTGGASLASSVFFLKQLIAAASVSATATRSIGIVRAVDAAAAASFSRIVVLSRSVDAAASAALSRSVSVMRSAASTVTASVTRGIDLLHTVTVTGSASLSKVMGLIEKMLTASVTATASLARDFWLVRQATSTASASYIRALNLLHSVFVNATPSLQTIKVYLLELIAAVVASTGSIIRDVRLIRVTAATCSTAVQRTISIARAVLVTGTSLLSQLLTFTPVIPILGSGLKPQTRQYWLTRRKFRF